MANNRFLGALGLATKAGKVVSGEDMTEKTIRGGGAYLVLIAKDASDGTRKKFNDHCQYYNVPICYVESREVLGRMLGKEFRAVGAVTDEKFSTMIMQKYDQESCK